MHLRGLTEQFILSAAWAAGLAAGLAGAAHAEAPSFDCAKAENDAEHLVCDTPALAALDVELARVFEMAVNETARDPERAKTLKATQRGWIKGRDACWTSDLGMAACVTNEYAFRIDALRREYAAARGGDGASIGPFAYGCDGLDAGLSATFVNTSAPLVVLRWRDKAIVLPQVVAASGAKYAADTWMDYDADRAGPSVFWTHGREAQFQFAGGDTMTCVQDTTG